MGFRTSRLVAVAVALAVLAPAGATGAEPTIPKVDTALYLRPARLVAVEGKRRLNLLCMGKGSPMVILESGLGSGATAWRNVQAGVAEFTRVCAYDRAGYGFSDPITRPSTGQNAADDLHRLLKAAGVREPVVLVGHSAGGLYVQMFATDHPELTAGVILVDASGRNEERMVWQILTDEEKADTTINARAAKARRTECLARARAGTVGQDKSCAPYPTGDGALDAELARRSTELKTWEALDSEGASFQSIDGTGEGSVTMEQAIAKPFRLGDKPLVILSATHGSVPAGERGKRLQEMSAVDTAAILSASPQGKLVLVSGSGHMVQDDRPEVVISTTRDVVQPVRARSSARR